MDIVDLGAENDERMARLREALALGDGFQLAIVQVEPGEQREEVLRRLQGWSGRNGVPRLELVRVEPGESPMMRLAGEHTGVILVGLEEERADDGQRFRERLAELNWSRDRLPELVHGPLVLVVSQRVQSALFEQAPDFYSWRAHTTSIAPQPDGLVQPTSWGDIEIEDPEELESLISSTSSLDPRPVAELGHLYARLAQARALRGQRAESNAAFEAAYDAYVRAGTQDARVELLILRSDAARNRGDFDEAADWLARARQEAAQGPPSPRIAAELLSQGVFVAVARGDHASAAVEIPRAIAAARELGSASLEVSLMSAEFQVAFLSGRTGDATDLLERALTLCRRAKRPSDEAGILLLLSGVAALGGRSDDAERYGMEAVARAEASGAADVVAEARAALGRTALENNNLALAESVLAENTPTIGNLARGRLAHARARLALVHHDDTVAERYLNEALEAYRRAGMSSDVSTVSLELGELGKRTRNWTVALTGFEAADRLGDSSKRARAALGLAELAYERGDRSAALADQFEIAEHMLMAAGQATRADLSRLPRAVILGQLGRWEEVRQALTTARAGFEARGQTELAAGVQRMLAKLAGHDPAG